MHHVQTDTIVLIPPKSLCLVPWAASALAVLPYAVLALVDTRYTLCPHNEHTSVFHDGFLLILCSYRALLLQCPSAATAPSPCAPGYWSPGGLQYCLLCSPGYFCAAGSSTTSPVADIVLAGTYYDPVEAVAVQQCPAGQYGIASGGVSVTTACFPCPSGYYCPTGSTDNNGQKPYLSCLPGSYCPGGSSIGSQYLCEAGTYNTLSGSSSPADCLTCPEVQQPLTLESKVIPSFFAMLLPMICFLDWHTCACARVRVTMRARPCEALAPLAYHGGGPVLRARV